MNYRHRDFSLLFLVLLATAGLSSCTTFYTSPPAPTPTFEKSGELQTTFYRSESGTAIEADVSFDSPFSLEDGGSEGLPDKMFPFAWFQLYDHVRNLRDSSDLRDQTEFDGGIGLFGRQGNWHLGASVGLAGGETDVDYIRSGVDTTAIIFFFRRSSSEHVEGTYIRPHFDIYGGFGTDLPLLPVRLEAGGFGRLHIPFFLTSTATDSTLNRIALLFELGIYARLTLLDLIAVEWKGGVGVPIISSSDWYYEYGTFGVRLILGR